LIVRQIPNNIFSIIQKNIPLSCVDAILINKKNEFLLVKRSILPYKNKWCLPGGIIKRNQKILDKLDEIGKKELGIKFESVKPIGFYEKIYPNRHDIAHCFLVKASSYDPTLDYQASVGKFFKKIPNNTSIFHAKMLKDAGFS